MHVLGGKNGNFSCKDRQFSTRRLYAKMPNNKKIEGDGNCFFRAVAEILDVPHEVVRQELIIYLEDEAAEYQKLCGIDDALDYFKLVHELCMQGQWNNDLADLLPHVLCKCYDMYVRVLTREFKTLQTFGKLGQDRRITLILEASHYDLLLD